MNIKKNIVLVFLSIVVLSCNSSKMTNYRLSDGDIGRFDSLFSAWKQNWHTNPQTQISSNTNDGKELEEYPQLIAMGEKIIPPVIAKLIVEDNFFALPLYDDLQKDRRLKTQKANGGEQGRAKATVTNYMNMKLEEEQINKDDLELLSITVPYAIEKADSVTTFGIVPPARIFSLDMKRKNADIYLYLLEESKKSDVPVRIYLFSTTDDIAFVEMASEEEIKQLEAVKKDSLKNASLAKISLTVINEQLTCDSEKIIVSLTNSTDSLVSTGDWYKIEFLSDSGKWEEVKLTNVIFPLVDYEILPDQSITLDVFLYPLTTKYIPGQYRVWKEVISAKGKEFVNAPFAID